jgi:lysophospholipase L1-like esterase
MRFPLLAALVLAAAAAPVHAETLLVHGDSIAFGLAPYLQAARPGDVVVNAGMSGDVSSNVARFIARFDDAAPVDTVVLELGTNDAAEPALTPRRSVVNLRLMARYARSRGARVFVLTPPPSTCKVDICAPGGPAYDITEARRLYTHALAQLLVESRLPPRMTVVDTRDRWHEAVRGWWQNSDIYGLHPNELGYPLLAGWVSEALDAR